MKTITSKHALVNEKNATVHLSDTPLSAGAYQFELKNVTLIFLEDGTLEIKGEREHWGCVYEKVLVSEFKEEIDEKYIKTGYMHLLDWVFRLGEKQYVEGWYKLKRTTPYSAVVSKWFVVL